MYVSSTVYASVVARLQFPWNLASIIWGIPRPLRGRLYDVIARNRFRFFGKRAQCIVLTPDHQARLLTTAPGELHKNA